MRAMRWVLASLLFSVFMRFGQALLFLLRRDIAFRELIQNNFQTKIFFGFLAKGPPLLDVITNIKRRGGLLVTTIMAIHCEEPVIFAFLLTVHFRNNKILICLNFVMKR